MRAIGGEELADLRAERSDWFIEVQIHQIDSPSRGSDDLAARVAWSASRNSTERGVLKLARCSLVYAMTAVRRDRAPGSCTTNAFAQFAGGGRRGTLITAVGLRRRATASTCSISAADANPPQMYTSRAGRMRADCLRRRRFRRRCATSPRKRRRRGGRRVVEVAQHHVGSAQQYLAGFAVAGRVDAQFEVGDGPPGRWWRR